MPVHFGSMSESIRTVIDRNPQMRSGDVYVLNDPYHGGTHLPDITVVTPVYLEDADAAPGFFVASRGHHADIGGITPGSMPPFSAHIDEEGVLIDNFKLVEGGALRERLHCANCSAAALTPREIPAQNLADLRAQIAANAKGSLELKALVAHYGADTVQRLHAACAGQCRRVGAPRHQRRSRMAQFCCRSTTAPVSRWRCASIRALVAPASISPARARNCSDNFNAPRAVTTAAVLYVFRTLVGR